MEWLMGLFNDLSVNTAVNSILLRMQHMWFGAIIVSAFLTALFLVVALAHVEAGTKAKSRWMALTFCSLAVVAALIIFKPKPKMEPVQYMPPPTLVSENEDKPKDATIKKSAPKPTGPSGGLAGGEKAQGATGKTQEAQGQTKDPPEKAQGEPGLKEAKDEKVEYRDPILEEILKFKRQAEESSMESALEAPTVAKEPTVELFSDTSSSIQRSQGEKNTDSSEPAQVGKAKVLVSSLNVRDKDSMDGKIIGLLETGEIVEVLSQPGTGEWVNITLSNGQKGWVVKKYLKMLP